MTSHQYMLIYDFIVISSMSGNKSQFERHSRAGHLIFQCHATLSSSYCLYISQYGILNEHDE